MNRHNSRKLHSLVIFRSILSQEPVKRLTALFDCDETDKNDITDKYCAFAESMLSCGGNLTEYLLCLVLEDENIYTKYKVTGEGDAELLEPLLDRELSVLEELSQYTGEQLRKFTGDDTLAHWKTSKADFHKIYADRMGEIDKKGFGIYAKYHMFVLDENGNVVPIKNPDPQKISDLSGYERERGLIIANTKALLCGKPAKNVLIYGDAGTGKSSTVKAIGNEFAADGLRIIELKKDQLRLIPHLLDAISTNPLKFILFIDDLSFSSDDDCFGALKATLEGSVSARADNIAIYATSNRRHLVKESFSDRDGDDVHRNDTIQELISLSARFGLKVNFSKPDKNSYFEIVKALADKNNIALEENQLSVQAEAFALKNGGRSARTAKQFVNQLINDRRN